MQQRVVIAMALAVEPGAADPRRADHRPRRHRRGRGARPGRRAARRSLGTLGAVHQPQPRRDREDVRPGRRAVRRQAGRGGRRRSRSSTTRATPTRVGLLRCLPRGGQRKDHGRLDTIPGFLPAPGAQLPAASSPTAARSPTTAAAPSRRRRYDVGGGRHQPLPLPREGARRCRATRPASWPLATALDTQRQRRSCAPRRCRKTFRQSGHDVHALAGVSLDLCAGRDARPGRRVGQRQDHARRAAARHHRARRRAASLELDGARAGAATLGKRSGEQVEALQIVFQNPDSALNRAHTVRRLIGRALTKLAGLSRATRRGSGCSS